jgi:hypothetical protein
MNREDHPQSLDPVTGCEALVIVMAIVVITLFLTPGRSSTKLPFTQALVDTAAVKAAPLRCMQ